VNYFKFNIHKNYFLSYNYLTKSLKIILKKSTLKTKFKLNPNLIISDLIEQYPEAGLFLITEYGINCVNCFAAGYDTLKEGAEIHGIVGKDFKDMLAALEKFILNDIPANEDHSHSSSL